MRKALIAIAACMTVAITTHATAQTSMPTAMDIEAARLTALDIQLRKAQQQHDAGYWSDNIGYDNPFLPDAINDFSNTGSFGGGGAGRESVLSPSLEIDVSTD
jgi:hypothetical protein